VDAGENLEIWRARPGAIHGWLSLSIDIQRVTPTQMDHLAGAEPDRDGCRVGAGVETHDGRRAQIPSVMEIVECGRLHGGQLSAGPRHCALIGRQHPQKTPTLGRKDDACGTGLQAVCTEIGVGVCRNRNERAKAEGDWLVFVEANVTREKSEV